MAAANYVDISSLRQRGNVAFDFSKNLPFDLVFTYLRERIIATKVDLKISPARGPTVLSTADRKAIERFAGSSSSTFEYRTSRNSSHGCTAAITACCW